MGLNLFKYREIAQIARRENAVQQTLIKKLQDTQQQLLQSEKMASVGQLAAGVAHEINNPIGFVNSNMSSLQGYISTLIDVIEQYKNFHSQLALSNDKLNLIADIDKKADLAYIQQDIHNLFAESTDGLGRVKDIVQSLKDFARIGSNEWADADIHHGLDSTLNIVKNEIKYKAVIEKNYGTIPRVYCIISQLNQVFMNLFINAAHAIQEKGTITISTGVEIKEGAEWVWIKVKDTGSGIAPENKHRIFDPFFTTKPIGSGTGLGLSLSYGIIKNHHGHIDVESEVGKGACFTIVLPVKGKLQQAV
jgi:two-component system, NtrC family, sensor kinase